MALRSQSLFLFGFEVTPLNQWIDFKATSLGPVLSGKLNIGFYSLTDLLKEIKRAMEVVDIANVYTVTADRTIMNGTENRVTIATSGAFLSILFSSGSHAASSVRTLIGFTATDLTGATTYTSTSSSGLVMIPTEVGFSYVDPSESRKVFGAVNLSTSGVKEAIVFQLQRFSQVEYKYEAGATIPTKWTPFIDWAIEQKPFDFTPEIQAPTILYNMTLEKTGQDGSGLAWDLMEMLPEFPFLYRTGIFRMRVIEL